MAITSSIQTAVAEELFLKYYCYAYPIHQIDYCLSGDSNILRLYSAHLAK